MPKETAEQRKARIRARLAQANTSQEAITRNVDSPRSTTQENKARMQERDLAAQKEYEKASSATQEQVEETDEKKSTPTTPRPPSSANIAKRVVERRQSKPTNYKIHVVTALALTLAVRVLALGPKAAFGGK